MSRVIYNSIHCLLSFNYNILVVFLESDNGSIGEQFVFLGRRKFVCEEREFVIINSLVLNLACESEISNWSFFACFAI